MPTDLVAGAYGRRPSSQDDSTTVEGVCGSWSMS